MLPGQDGVKYKLGTLLRLTHWLCKTKQNMRFRYTRTVLAKIQNPLCEQ
jgi:hypothetical protein